MSATAVILIVISIICWGGSIFTLFKRPLLSPVLSFIALWVLSFANNDYGLQLLPINNTIIYGWLCMTLVVMLATVLQPAGVVQQTRGVGYMTIGAFVGLAVGLLGYTVIADLSVRYGIMVAAVAVGVVFGYLMFTNTPQGADVSLRSGNFLRYLAAKGFPVAISVMMMGIPAVILVGMAE